MEKNIEELKEAYWKLAEELGHEPSAHEIDRCEYMVSSRQIQRNLGGLVAFRGLVGSKEVDQTKGVKRSEYMAKKNEESKQSEKDLFIQLLTKYDSKDVMVLREYCYQQYATSETEKWYKNTFCDVALIYDTHVVLFDFFNPIDMDSFDGCIRTKLNKAKNSPIALRPDVTHELFFVCTNPLLSQKMIDGSVLNGRGVELFSLDSFTKRFL